MSPPSQIYPPWVAYEPELVPPLEIMALEGIGVLEEWFRWGDEWAVMLRAYAGAGRASAVLEIGCGLGRITFSLRYLLDRGRYDGFEIVRRKIDFLKSTFEPAGFDKPDFNLVHPFSADSDGCALAFPDDPERMTGYRLSFITQLAEDAGLRVQEPPLPGYWSGEPNYIGARDLVVLIKPA